MTEPPPPPNLAELAAALGIPAELTGGAAADPAAGALLGSLLGQAQSAMSRMSSGPSSGQLAGMIAAARRDVLEALGDRFALLDSRMDQLTAQLGEVRTLLSAYFAMRAQQRDEGGDA